MGLITSTKVKSISATANVGKRGGGTIAIQTTLQAERERERERDREREGGKQGEGKEIIVSRYVKKS